MVANTLVRKDPEERRKYDVRRRRVERSFSTLRRGAKAKCAFDLRLHPSRVTNVVNGRTISVNDLTAIEAWVHRIEAPADQ